MDLEAVPIQVQTPPKEDEIETLPEPVDPIESFEMVEKADEEEEEEEEEEVEGNQVAEEAREDEIVVENAKNGIKQQNDDEDQESSLSSAPGSEVDPPTPKTGLYFICFSRPKL